MLVRDAKSAIGGEEAEEEEKTEREGERRREGECEEDDRKRKRGKLRGGGRKRGKRRREGGYGREDRKVNVKMVEHIREKGVIGSGREGEYGGEGKGKKEKGRRSGGVNEG